MTEFEKARADEMGVVAYRLWEGFRIADDTPDSFKAMAREAIAALDAFRAIESESATSWEQHGNASLSIEIRNGSELMVCGTGLTTEQACEAVAAYLPMESPFDR
jgi:hypothetical protein